VCISQNCANVRARIDVQTRQQALLEQVRAWLFCLLLQDIASEHSSMPYRAPELFDVKTGKMLDEKVDIWVC
jgi:serine/threonine kinase 16